MAQEPTEVPAEAQDPETDTPETPAAEPGEDTPEPEQQVDYKARWEKAQELIGRQGHELGLYRRGETPEDDGSGDEPDEGDEQQSATAADPYLARLEDQSWELAEQLYGPQAVEAYGIAARIFNKAETPADHLAAFEAYYEARSGGASPGQATAAAAAPATSRTRAEAVQPRVDANRSDAGPDPSETAKLEEARKGKDLGAFTRAATRALGFGGPQA